MTGFAIYIHWPFCKSKCPYCDFNSHVRENVEQERWKNALLRELDHMAAHTLSRRATSIFFGGGTPSLMPPDTVSALIERVQKHWPGTNDIEITLEANPTSIEAEKFRAFAKAGVNRVSIGVQSFDDAQLKFLGRGHNAGEATRAIELARDIFPRYSFDLIYARPQQSLGRWERELTQALALSRGHLSLYQLTIEENTAFHTAYAKHEFALPDEAESEALYRLTEELTAAHNLHAYEISNYASHGQESRHNLAYWLGHDYVGVGPGAHGRLTIESARHATQTIKSPERWLSQVETKGHGVEVWNKLDSKDAMEERIMMGLRLTAGIDARDFTGHINEKKRRFYIEKGLLENRDDWLQPTLKGRLLLNKLTAELFL